MRELQYKHADQTPAEISRAAGRGRVAPTLLLWKSGQETVKIRGWRAWALTLCPAETIHPLTHPLIFPLPSCPILSLPFPPFSRPPLLSGRKSCSDAPWTWRVPILSTWCSILLWSVPTYRWLHPPCGNADKNLSCHRFTDASFHSKEAWAGKGLNDSPKIT